MVKLAELKVYTMKAMEDRGVPFDRIVDVFLKLLQEDRSELIAKGINPDIKKEEAARYLSIAFENEKLLQSALVGIELDVLAERGELREPLLSMIRADEPLMPVDETLVKGALDRDAEDEFGHQDTHKVGIVKELDQSKDRVHTFMDDIVGAFVAQASSVYQKDQVYRKKMGEREEYLANLSSEERKEVNQFMQLYDSASGERLNGQSFQKFVNQIPILFPEKSPEEQYPREFLEGIKVDRPFAEMRSNSSAKKFNEELVRTSSVLRSAIAQLKKRGVNFKSLGEVSFLMEKNYLDGLSLYEHIKPAQHKVVTDKRELHAVYLIAAEMDRKFGRRELTPMMQRLMEDRENFHPARIIAREGTRLYGGISITNFGKLTKLGHQNDLFSSELLNWYQDSKHVFTPEVALMIIANTNGRVAHLFKDQSDKRTERLEKAGEARGAMRKFGSEALRKVKIANDRFASSARYLRAIAGHTRDR